MIKRNTQILCNLRVSARSEKPTSLRQSKDGTMSVVNMALFSEKLAYAVDQAEEQAKSINIL